MNIEEKYKMLNEVKEKEEQLDKIGKFLTRGSSDFSKDKFYSQKNDDYSLLEMYKDFWSMTLFGLEKIFFQRSPWGGDSTFELDKDLALCVWEAFQRRAVELKKEIKEGKEKIFE